MDIYTNLIQNLINTDSNRFKKINKILYIVKFLNLDKVLY